MEEIQFLKDLQQELKTQDHDVQAAPRFWTVGDYQWVGTWDESAAERYSVYVPDDGEASELNEYLKEIEGRLDEFSEDAEAEFKEIGCEVSALEWIKDNVDSGAYLIPEEKVHVIRQNTMFLTKAEAKKHIEINHYHYSSEAHTYAMTAWRAPKVERLLNILENFDWDAIEVKEAARED